VSAGTLRIREVLPEDVGAVHRIGEVCAPALWGEVPDSREQIAAWPTDHFLVAEVDGAVVGFARGEVREARDVCIMPDGTRYLEVEGAYVRPEFQRRGIGSALLKRLLDDARAAGIDRFQVYTGSKTLDDALDFYRRAGFGTWYARLFI
jgi:GNAT superfamily N-acetyltransferase